MSKPSKKYFRGAFSLLIWTLIWLGLITLATGCAGDSNSRRIPLRADRAADSKQEKGSPFEKTHEKSKTDEKFEKKTKKDNGASLTVQEIPIGQYEAQPFQLTLKEKSSGEEFQLKKLSADEAKVGVFEECLDSEDVPCFEYSQNLEDDGVTPFLRETQNYEFVAPPLFTIKDNQNKNDQQQASQKDDEEIPQSAVSIHSELYQLIRFEANPENTASERGAGLHMLNTKAIDEKDERAFSNLIRKENFNEDTTSYEKKIGDKIYSVQFSMDSSDINTLYVSVILEGPANKKEIKNNKDSFSDPFRAEFQVEYRLVN